MVLKESNWDDKFPAGLRVLVVDDDPLCLKVVEHMLKRCKYAGAGPWAAARSRGRA